MVADAGDSLGNDSQCKQTTPIITENRAVNQSPLAVQNLPKPAFLLPDYLNVAEQADLPAVVSQPCESSSSTFTCKDRPCQLHSDFKQPNVRLVSQCRYAAFALTEDCQSCQNSCSIGILKSVNHMDNRNVAHVCIDHLGTISTPSGLQEKSQILLDIDAFRGSKPLEPFLNNGLACVLAEEVHTTTTLEIAESGDFDSQSTKRLLESSTRSSPCSCQAMTCVSTHALTLPLSTGTRGGPHCYMVVPMFGIQQKLTRKQLIQLTAMMGLGFMLVVVIFIWVFSPIWF